MGTGTLYGTRKRLLTAGLVEESDERRRYYRLTSLGRRVAAAEAERLS